MNLDFGIVLGGGGKGRSFLPTIPPPAMKQWEKLRLGLFTSIVSTELTKGIARLGLGRFLLVLPLAHSGVRVHKVEREREERERERESHATDQGLLCTGFPCYLGDAAGCRADTMSMAA